MEYGFYSQSLIPNDKASNGLYRRSQEISTEVNAIDAFRSDGVGVGVGGVVGVGSLIFPQKFSLWARGPQFSGLCLIGVYFHPLFIQGVLIFVPYIFASTACMQLENNENNRRLTILFWLCMSPNTSLSYICFHFAVCLRYAQKGARISRVT